MDFSAIPCYYVPSKVVLVDDDQQFLKSTKLVFANHFHSQTFSKPYDALDYLNQEYHFERMSVVKTLEDSELEQASFNINIRNIHREIYNPNRFNEIAVVVTDYAMPGMDGLTFCKSLKVRNIKRLLLTGEASVDLAVVAFNAHLIDQFILKSDAQLINTVKSEIQKAQFSYFLDLSKNMFGNVKLISALEDSVFIRFFNDMLKKHQTVEFYLLDKQGSFLLLDRVGNPTWLIVKDEEEMSGIQEVADLADAPGNILDVLNKRSYVPYFYSEADFKSNPIDWYQYMHPATILEGDEKRYYYAVITEPSIYPLDTTKIVSYQDFIANRNM